SHSAHRIVSSCARTEVPLANVSAIPAKTPVNLLPIIVSSLVVFGLHQQAVLSVSHAVVLLRRMAVPVLPDRFPSRSRHRATTCFFFLIWYYQPARSVKRFLGGICRDTASKRP